MSAPITRPAYQFKPCPAHPGRNVAHHPCGICGYGETAPNLLLVQEPFKESEETSAMLTAVNSEARMEVDPDTGEINPAQLTMFDAPAEYQRRSACTAAARDEAAELAAATIRGMREGDRLSVTIKDGQAAFKLVQGWRRDE